MCYSTLPQAFIGHVRRDDGWMVVVLGIEEVE
jgi:hypothetical protein